MERNAVPPEEFPSLLDAAEPGPPEIVSDCLGSRRYAAMETQVMQSVVLLLLGSALILAGVFGIVEVLIRRRSRHALSPEAFERPEAAPAMPSPSLVPTDQDLEMVIVRDRETNPDGRTRQEIIRQLQIGDPVLLVPELLDDDRRSDIRVDTLEGTIGYVPRNKVPTLLDVLTAGADARSEISQIGHAGVVSGVWISVSTWR
jgi:hypothetical protein